MAMTEADKANMRELWKRAFATVSPAERKAEILKKFALAESAFVAIEALLELNDGE